MSLAVILNLKALLQVLDTVSGVIIGAFMFLNLASAAPVISHCFRRQAPVALVALALVAIGAAAGGSLMPRGYTEEMPKRLVIQHHHQQQGNGPVSTSKWVQAACLVKGLQSVQWCQH